jgi:hypothetical protein
MPKYRAYDSAEIATIRETIKALPKKERALARVTMPDLVKQMRGEIRAAVARGYTLDEVITALNSAGNFDLKTPTVKRYLNDTPRKRTTGARSGRFLGRKNGETATQETESGRKSASAVELPSAADL